MGHLEVTSGDPPELCSRRVQQPLPGVGTRRVAEERRALRPLQPVLPSGLMVSDPSGKLFHRRDSVVDNRAIANRGTHDLVAEGDEGIDQFGKVDTVDDDRNPLISGRPTHKR